VKGYQSSPAAWERFLLIRSSPTSTTVAFKSLRSNRYVVPVAPPAFSDSDQWGGASSDPSTWPDKDAKWLGSNGGLTNFTLGSAALNSPTTIRVPGGNLWSCDDWGNHPIRLKSTNSGDWESFTIEPAD
jgi:hypothetical protein